VGSVNIGGNMLQIQASKYKNASALKRSVFKALKENGIDIGISDIKIDNKDIMKSDLSDDVIPKIINIVLSLAESEEIERYLFDCCEGVALWGSKKDLINEEFFDDPDNRQYYYPIMVEVLKVNLMPFFAGLSFLFQGAGKLKEFFQK